MVEPSGARSWVFRMQVAGKRQDFGLGSVSTLSLAQARTKAADFADKINRGEDPRPVAAPSKVKVPTFAEAACACYEALKSGWSNQRHRDSWLASLEGHIFPTLGAVAVDKVTSVMVRDALAPIWLTIPETARRIFQRIRTVLDYAHIEGWCAHEASLRSVVRGLPRQSAVESHFASLPYAEVPALIKELEALPEKAGREALLFTIYNAVRSGETRFARWSEIDIEAGTWAIPAARMKMKKEHVVPLAPAALAVLKRRWPLRATDDGLVFSSHGTKPLSDMTMTKVLRDLGRIGITVHGFRSSFTDWAAEATEFPKEVVDKALAHKLIDRVEAAYRRTDFFERRRALMGAWVSFLIDSEQ